MFDGIEFRGVAQASGEELADHAGVPVWNGLTDEWHATQMLADILTITEHSDGPLEEIACCFLGDGYNNLAPSLLVTGTRRHETKFMHCLPSVHNTDTDLGRRVREKFQVNGAEVTDEVFESPASIVFNQNENCLHTIRAVMSRAVGA
jgi:ornithine carbamoyltransferase